MTMADIRRNNLDMAVALFLLSFSTVLYTLVVFRLLSFFIMPSLFFDLLFIGFPVGALLASYFFKVNTRSFIWAICILQVMLILSTFAVLFAHNFSYLKVNLFQVEVKHMIVIITVFTVLFLPYFVSYGLSEYIGYQVGRERFQSKMHTVYAIILFGAAGSYLTSYWLVPILGVVKLMLTAFVITVLVCIILSRGKSKVFFTGQLLLLVGVFFIPDLEETFLTKYKGIAPASTAFYKAKDFKTVYQKWGKYSLNEILQTPDGEAYYGFYNDFLQWEYFPEWGYDKPSLGTVPLLMMPKDSRKLIIGSGAGRQVRFATANQHINITAVEIEPAVIEAVRSPEYLLEEFNHVYDHTGVQVVQSEGRKYLEKIPQPQDLIYLPSVGGYPQMMLEPGNLIRTFEAYQLAAEKLTADGILAIWYPSGLDPKGILTNQYVETLRFLKMAVKSYRNNEEFLILASPDKQRHLPTFEDLLELLLDHYTRAGGSKHTFPISLIPADYQTSEEPSFQPVTDNRPYLGGNISHIFSHRQIFQLYGFAAVVILTLGLLLYISLRKKGNPGITNRSYFSVALLSFLLGANFLLVEHHLVFVLFSINYVFHDALMMGAVIFLILSGIGSTISDSKTRNILLSVAIPCYIVLVLAGSLLPDFIRLALIVPGAAAAGTFFPLLFDKAAKNPLAIFALDAVGAAVGSMLAAAIPILFGFQVYGYLVLTILCITIIMDKWFHSSQIPKYFQS